MQSQKVVDPRYIQMSAQALIILFGMAVGAFYLPLPTLGGYSLLFVLFFLAKNQRSFEGHLSSLLSLLSLFILVRVDSPLYAFFLGFIALSSKRFLTLKGRHVFNPSNIAVVLGLLFFSGHVWVSPGRWGTTGPLLFIILSTGFLVNRQLKRLEVPCVFLLAYMGLYLVRALYLNDPMPLFIHQVTQASLILFAFLTLTDPRTTPDHFYGRVGFSIFVAVIAYLLETQLYMRAGLFFALCLGNLMNPIFNMIWNDQRFVWKKQSLS